MPDDQLQTTRLMKNYLTYILGALLLLGISCKQDTQTKENPDAGNLAVREWKPDDMRNMTGLTAQRGLIVNTDRDTEGYVLFEPSSDTTTFLIDKAGRVVHRWDSELNSMNSYLLPNGHLLRLERDEDFPTFAAGGQAGRVREYDWDGNMLWDYELATETELIHHDIEPMPNGNILAIAYEVMPVEEAIAMGRDPERLPRAGLWLDQVVEIRPTYPKGGEIVWEWHMKDHLVQDFDPSKANYGDPSEHPRKIDINFHSTEEGDGPPPTEEQVKQMIKNGMATSNATVDNRGSDITHTNAIDYHPGLDQIALSSPGMNEIFIIDHSTTTEEARGRSGGNQGHGGDLLYRWGNPQNYGLGTPDDRVLFGQHDIRWIPEGQPGAGRLMVYNNDPHDGKAKLPTVWAGFQNAKPPEFAMAVGDVGNFSEVLELEPPTDADGAYVLDAGGTFGPEEPAWTYRAPDLYSFYSAFISGAHRLPNGNTFITEGMKGRFFEVSPDNEIVWEYWNPYMGTYKLPDGTEPQPKGPFIFGVFRSTLIPADNPAFAGKTLEPLQPQPEVYKMPPPPAEPEGQ
ncbi:hypothetical protein RB2501_10412 [Robiginitalea biformata HTCC2501]|uniref:Arylsulfotransferase ASST n=2 Tax=Robiginitalea TaxID=252306 RepID=A4CM39_ROBBH|nr:hypothetical protein RB2501_10412 [Robiginitalea biformata HTCC2501]